MIGRFALVILVLALSVASPRLRDETAPGSDAELMATPAIRPIDVVTSSVSRGLASLGSQPLGFNRGEERRAEIRGTARDLFDVDGMARRALGQRWKGLSPREQAEFVRLFEDTLTQPLIMIVDQYTGYAVTSLDEEIVGTFARVRSRITLEQGSEIAIEYRLSQRGSQWRAYDIVFDGVSLVSNYRSQFNSIIGTSSVAHLLERMRATRSRGPRGRDAVGGVMTEELETLARGRLAAGLLLTAASYSRSR